ncbi:MAG: thioredoxin domain-containing protein, partial [Candidatus Gracilibacteria bacterium]|nr:thioredoxin domain-containing protein [Candidatus Gracilibacteria bacterium]
MEEYRQPGQGSQKGLILAIVFSALVVSGSLFFLGLQMGGSKMAANVVANNAPAAAVPSPVAPANPTITASLDELVDDDPFMGDDDAPVTIIEWTDYQCPFCGRHSTQTLPSIKKEYIDTGKVKYVLRDLALSFHPNALPGAKAANCAGEQEKYWEMHDLI